LETVLDENSNAKFARSELPGEPPLRIPGASVSANAQTSSKRRQSHIKSLRPQRLSGVHPRRLTATMSSLNASRADMHILANDSPEKTSSNEGELVVWKPGGDTHRKVSLVESRREDEIERDQPKFDANNKHNKNKNNHGGMTPTFSRSTAYLSGAINLEEGTRIVGGQETMSFKRGTLWLMEAIEKGKDGIDYRIVRYMKKNGSKVRKSTKGWVRLQKIWDKNLQISDGLKTGTESNVDQKESEDRPKRASVMASDSAEKMRDYLDGNVNRPTRLKSQMAELSNDTGTGRIGYGEIVRSKRGVSFREVELSSDIRSNGGDGDAERL